MAIGDHFLTWPKFLDKLAKEVVSYGGLGESWMQEYKSISEVQDKAAFIQEQVNALAELTDDLNLHYQAMVRCVFRPYSAKLGHALTNALNNKQLSTTIVFLKMQCLVSRLIYVIYKRMTVAKDTLTAVQQEVLGIYAIVILCIFMAPIILLLVFA